MVTPSARSAVRAEVGTMRRPWAIYGLLAVLTSVTGILLYFIVSSEYEFRRDSENRKREQAETYGEWHRQLYANYWSRRYRPPLEELYEILNDTSRRTEWGDVIRTIASYGRSEESSRRLLEFAQTDDPSAVLRPQLHGMSITKMEALMLLSYTGSDSEKDLLLALFLDEAESGINLPWLDRLNADSDEGCLNMNVLRGRIAIGLVCDGDETYESRVREFFESLRTGMETDPGLNRCDEGLFWILVDSLAVGDAIKELHRNALLTPPSPGFSRSHRVKYVPRDEESIRRASGPGPIY